MRKKTESTPVAEALVDACAGRDPHRQQSLDLADAWYRAVVTDDAMTDAARNHMHERFGELAWRVMDLLAAPTLHQPEAKQVGTDLADLCPMEPTAIGRTLNLLSTYFTTGLPADEAQVRVGHLHPVLADIAAGYCERAIAIATAEPRAERRRAESALRESEARYRALIETSPDAIFLSDSNGIIRLCNARATEIVGLQEISQILGRDIRGFIHPEDVDRVSEDLDRTLHDGRVLGLEYRVCPANGTVLSVEVSLAAIATPGGMLPSVIGIVHDQTARKEAELALRRSNAELQALNTIAVQTTQRRDLRGLAEVALNAAASLIASAVTWVHLTAPHAGGDTQAIHLERGEKNAAATCSARATTVTDEVLTQAQTLVMIDDTQLRPFSIAERTDQDSYLALGLPILAQHRTVGVLGVIVDPQRDRHLRREDVHFLEAVASQISMAVEYAHLSRIAAENALLQQVNQLRSELVTGFSHDLKTPLGVIKFSSTTLMREDVAFSRETQLELLKDIDESVDRLDLIVERVLALGSLQSDALHLRQEPINLTMLIRSVTSAMERGLTKHKLTHDIEPPVIVANIDAPRVIEVFSNLLDNAIKYSPTGGTINVRARLDGTQVLISVTDEGIGIPEDELVRIFECFYRADSDLTHHVAGVGLGLVVCKGIVEAHGGQIWAESSPGAGTTIYFTLPAALEDMETPPE